MVLQVMLIENVVDKALVAVPIILWQRIRKRHVPFEIVKLLGQLVEVFNKEHLFLGARAIPEGNLAIAVLQTLELVEDMRPHRGHASTTADEHHLFLCLAGKEFAEGARNRDLVAGLEVEDVG